jgi:YD repeat-containing protein
VATRCFYRVKQPQAEVFSIEPPVLTENGGRLVIQGQSLPPGSSLMLETEGGATQFFALVAQADGTWHADVTGTFSLDAALTARVRAGGQTLGTAIHPVVTRNGLMADGPSSLPPAAPIPAAMGNPVTGIGIVVKKHVCKPTPMGPNLRVASGAGSDNTPIVKGSALGHLRGTPTKLGGDCQDTGTNAQHRSGNPLYDSQGREVVNPLYGSGMSAPLSSGLPGEAGFHACDLALNTPAGPALAWVRTYRSKGGSAPHGTSFSYDIRIEPDPASLGAAAPRVRVFDGTGRSDIFHRQPDGSYTCDGIFREGRFDGETFTLTFFDQGRWVFHPLDGSSTAGKITSIIDVHGNALTCDYDAGGLLGSVSNSLGQSLSVVHDDQGRVATVTDHTGRFVSYEYYQQGETDGPPGAVKSVSCPIIPGQPPVAEPTTYTYTTGQAHPALDGNLLSIHDGAGRLLEAFTYSSQSDPREVDFDTIATHDAHRTDPASDAVSVLKLVRLPDGAAPRGGYTVFHNDEAGRLTEVVCDAQHRPVSVKQFTGFATPGVACDATTNRPSNKLRSTDPDFFETTASYNADGMPRRCTLPDGSQLVAVFERDLNPACATRERGNARTLTIRSAGGEERTVSCDYLPGFGTPESMRPGNPIGGLRSKAAATPGAMWPPPGSASARKSSIRLGTTTATASA